ncbi:MAG: YfhO family protein, partial [Lachnospiraceae bacterium]
PFAMADMDAIKAGNWGWAWYLDLGSSLIGGQSFYTLGNPSFWLAAIFPSDWFMYVVGWIYALKYAVATLTAYMYIRQYVKNYRTASIGAILYAFSGYMATDLLFYHFHDVVALFPLLLLAFDALMVRGRKGPLIFAVLINALVNYFFIIGEIIFLVAYYIICYLVPDFRKNIKKLPQILFEGALGCLLGAALLVPSFLFTVQNPRVEVDYTGSNSGVFSFERYLYILKGLLFPGEVMSHQCAVIRSNFSSCNAYLPMVGMVLVIAFLSLHKKHWVSRMLKFSLVMAIVPFFNASFSLFAGLYCRWYYMPVLIMALASAIMLERWDVERKAADHEAYLAIRQTREERRRRQAEELANGPATIAEAAALAKESQQMQAYGAGSASGTSGTGKVSPTGEPMATVGGRFADEPMPLPRMTKPHVPDPEGRPKRKSTVSEKAITKGFIIWGLIYAGFVCFLLFVPWSKNDPSKIFEMWQFAIWASVSAAGTLVTWLILTKKKKKRLRTFTFAVMFFAILTTGGLVLSYQIVHGENAKSIYDRLMTSAKIEYNTPEYRFQGRDNLETLAHAYPTSGNFCSTVSGSIFRFYEGLGLSRDVKSPDAPDGLYTLISARYYTSRKPKEDEEPIQTIHGDSHTYYVYEDESIPPIGFTQDTYMTMSDFLQTNTSTRAIRMVKTLIVKDEDEAKVSGVLRKYEDFLDGVPKAGDLKAYGEAHLEEASTNVEQDSWHYAVTITAAADKYAFFSIPNDDGWSCTVNDKSVKILDSNG